MCNVTLVLNGHVCCRTVEKISLSGGGGDALNTLLKDVEKESIPKSLGGTYEGFNEPYYFNTTPSGPFYCEADSAVSQADIATAQLAGVTLSETAEDTSNGKSSDGRKDKEEAAHILNESCETVSNSESCTSENDH